MPEPGPEQQALPPPLLDAAALRAAGRTPTLPFRIALETGQELVVHRLLRLLPGKRLVGEGVYGDARGPRLLVKLFVDAQSLRNWQREHAGLAALAAAGIPTPPVLAAAPLADGGHALLTAFLAPSHTLLQAWRAQGGLLPGDARAIALLRPAFTLLGRVHAAGLQHTDLHLGNFLYHGEGTDGQWLLLDGDAIRVHGQKPLAERYAAHDLAMLCAQLPRSWWLELADMAPLLTAYAGANPGTTLHAPSSTALQHALVLEQQRRLKDYLAKTRRDCTLFKVEHSFRRYAAVWRSEAEHLAPVLARPDAYLLAGTLLKDGNTCTVARIDVAGRALVIKRYNIKNSRHRLSRLFRSSRAAHSWREGHRLQLMGIPTPFPLALIEERLGPLRGRAWLLTEYCPGSNLLQHLDPDMPPPEPEARALGRLFAQLYRERLSHGDLKATNLLWDHDEIKLIDLDAMREHASCRGHLCAWRRDRRRLLQNWPPNSPLWLWLDAHLPQA